MKKILVVEDDLSIAELEKDYLEASNYQTDLRHTGEAGLAAALSHDYDLIILDVMLPDIDGYKVLAGIREKKETPVLLVTARVADIDKIKGFNAGADDYIVKPFSPLELTARVKAHIGRYEKLTGLKPGAGRSINRNIAVQDLRIDVSGRQVYKKDEAIDLTNKEFDLLLFLVNNPGEVFSKERLLDKVWGENAFVENSTVTVHINRLREKIEDNPVKPQYIATVWGRGYKFCTRPAR